MATVNVIREEKPAPDHGAVCSRQFGKEILEAIVRRLDTPYVVVDDSYFLDELEGKGVNRVFCRNHILWRDTPVIRPLNRCFVILMILPEKSPQRKNTEKTQA